MGRPDNNAYVKEYNDELLKVLQEEESTAMPVITEMNFGHTCPVFSLPYGAMAQIDCTSKTFSRVESGVEA
ncbi:S66 peptidase family protein [Spirosoma radiotolerans]|uniref:LD-carboxypeptidase C-terminal domain-containing protein n=1 Tax=Spirosoma radiotolerans TaxID=1379870 RepID=A0A0E3ZW03_9BACT|nr:hypothetical protein [Spirosoma radiotolerans]AKD55425.1 hypothetical protein SD10_11435 [Spirosoma radiotolerans]